MSNNVINPYQTFRDSTGAVRASGTVTFYVNGTTTLATIYSDEALTVTQTNPYTLDAFGRIVGDVKYQGLMTIKEANSDGSDPITTDNVATLETANQLRTDLADTATATNGDDLVGVKKTDSNTDATTQHDINELRIPWLAPNGDYNATADGATSDQTKLSNAITDQTTIQLQRGKTYAVDASTSWAGNLTILGDPLNKPTIKVTATIASILNANSSSASLCIKDCIIDGNYSTFNVTSAGILATTNGGDFYFHNVHFQNFSHYAVDITGQTTAGHVFFDHLCSFDNCGVGGSTRAIRVTGGRVKTVYIGDIDMKDGYDTVLIDDCQGVTLDGGFYHGFSNNGPTVRDTNTGGGAPTFRSQHITIKGLKATATDPNYCLAIGIEAAVWTITGCTLEDTGTTGKCMDIDIITNAPATAVDAYSTIVGNTCIGGDTSIRLNGASRIVVTGNTCKGAASQSIYTVNGANYNYIYGNNIHDKENANASTAGKNNVWGENNYVGIADTTVKITGTSPFTSPGNIVEYTSTQATVLGLLADTVIMNSSGANRNFALPPSATVGLGRQITVMRNSASNSVSVIEQAISVRSSIYAWAASGSGTSEYYLTDADGNQPFAYEFYTPESVQENGGDMTPGSVGSLAAGEWARGDNDSLGYNTLYVRLADSTDPDSKAAGWVTYKDFIYAGSVTHQTSIALAAIWDIGIFKTVPGGWSRIVL